MSAPLSNPSPAGALSPVAGLRVSVLVPTFNRANYLGECLDSLLAQSMAPLEIIVIDDGSEDGTAQLLQDYADRIRVVRQVNSGKSAAVNRGLSLAQGDLIWIFDDDDVALPHAIASRVEALLARPDAGFAYGPHFYGSDGADGRVRQGRLHELPEHRPEALFYELMKGCFFHLGTALVRADIYRKVGGFDADLLSSEDYDMQLRLARACPAAFSPQPSFIFRQHTGLRGAKSVRYGGAQRAQVFRHFDQRVGQKLRTSLPLGDYLVPRQRYLADRYSQRQAFLARMTVMASKGCLVEMVEDLQSALILLPADRAIPPAERQAITRAVCTGYAGHAISDHWGEFKSLLHQLPPSPAARSAVRSIAVGLFRLARGYPDPPAVRWLRLKAACRVAVGSFELRGLGA